MISFLSINCFIQTFIKIEGCEQIDHRMIFIRVNDKGFKHETFFDEAIIRTVIHVIQYEDDPDDNPILVTLLMPLIKKE